MSNNLKRKTEERSQRIMFNTIKKTTKIYLPVGLGLLLVSLLGCKNATTDELPATLLVNNECGVAVDVFMDGIFEFSLDNNEYNTILDVTIGTHPLVAKKKGTETLVHEDTAEITSLQNYVWTVLSSADLTITNAYGETLTIIGDGDVQGALSDGASNTLGRIPYGEHNMEAKTQDDTVVASLTIFIEENKEYIWTISK